MVGILDMPPPPGGTRIPYGDDPNQFGELRLPTGGGPHPVVIFIHGGFWRERYTLDHGTHLCQAVADAGYAVWSLEYRRIGQLGGGHAGTTADIEAGARFVVQLSGLDLDRVVVAGHSAGGYLALWLASRQAIPLRGVVALAAVSNLKRAQDLRLGNGVVDEFLEGAIPVPLPLIQIPQFLLHGTEDDIVPFDLSRQFAAERPRATLISLPGAGHFELIDPRTQEWQSLLTAVRNCCAEEER